MYKVSYTGNGTTTEFFFTFPYFENSNIVVTKNDVAATGYNIIGNSGGADANYPYTGGKIVFDVAPSSLDCITISRQLPLSRIADYQPTARIEPTILNQDLNYLLEVIKDRKEELEILRVQCGQITDAESVEALLSQIETIHNEIVTISQQMTEFGDLAQVNTDIANLKTSTTGIQDYVIASQAPTEANNHIWYRKYKSGWVEQGGWVAPSAQDNNGVIFPIPMANELYSVSVTAEYLGGLQFSARQVYQRTSTSMNVYESQKQSGNWPSWSWMICGMAA